jgi:hypothetical protein
MNVRSFALGSLALALTLAPFAAHARHSDSVRAGTYVATHYEFTTGLFDQAACQKEGGIWEAETGRCGMPGAKDTVVVTYKGERSYEVEADVVGPSGNPCQRSGKSIKVGADFVKFKAGKCVITVNFYSGPHSISMTSKGCGCGLNNNLAVDHAELAPAQK